MMDKHTMIALPGGREAVLPDEFREIADLCRAEEVMIGGRTVLGMADARDLHAGLGVGRDYTNWIKGRIKKYGFREGVDFEVVDSPNRANQGQGGDRRSIIYRLTLDTAKELAMVENNERGRLIRRYYIWLEGLAHGAEDELARRIDGVSRSTIHKVTGIEKMMRLMVRSLEEQDQRIEGLSQTVTDMVVTHDPRRVVQDYVLPLDIAERFKVPQKGRRALTQRIGNRLSRYCAAAEKPVKLSPETGRRMFPAEVVDTWLREEGRTLIAEHIANVSGQTVLPFPKGRS